MKFSLQLCLSALLLSATSQAHRGQESQSLSPEPSPYPRALQPNNPQLYCKSEPDAEGQCCHYHSVERTNEKLAPLLQDLVKTSFFRYWKTNLHKDCPFWEGSLECVLRDCSVEEAEEHEIPEAWKQSTLSSVSSELDDPFSLMSESCHFGPEDFCINDEKSIDGCYINLIKNPERYTAYGGESAARVWSAIYRENCFNLKEEDFVADLKKERSYGEVCLEKEIFYRLISGLHASISTHICDQYLNRKTGEWYQNLDCFIVRLGDHPERVKNMYFLHSLLTRAISKLSPYLLDHSTHPFCSSTSEDTHKIESLVEDIAHVANGCSNTFDERALFRDAESQSLKNEWKERFRNISMIMDCVSCEKCRLWGKLQTTGVGTALKVLFSFGDSATEYNLTRGEIVALFNTYNRLSESVEAVQRFRDMYAQKESHPHLHEPVSPPAAQATPETQLPPIPLDITGNLGQIRITNYVTYSIGLVMILIGFARFGMTLWQWKNKTLKLPEGFEWGTDGRIVNTEEIEKEQEKADKDREEEEWKEEFGREQDGVDVKKLTKRKRRHD
ncbi:hypothetical protein HDU85_006153 [Gaertneriomyces sp. JEL0708]|nr:hypothetical protein HDU85_006153 [Gaertneriomyces sp. JEL0708]